MAAVQAGRAARERGARFTVLVVDGATTIGAKILVAGGGRCNVTHDVVDETAFAGSTPPAIRKVLRRFDVDQTTRFFAAEGVALKREETGKLFPTTDSIFPTFIVERMSPPGHDGIYVEPFSGGNPFG